jgi:hypothetical protein
MTRENKNCLVCNNIFYKRKNLGIGVWSKQKYCSIKCSGIAQLNIPKKTKHTEEFKKAVSLRHKGKITSPETRRKMSVSSKGSKSFLWKGGISSDYHLQRSCVESKLWREAVIRRDNSTCIWCLKKSGWDKDEKIKVVLHADHIKPFLNYPELRFAIDNGRTLCAECHRKTDTYGSKVFLKRNMKNNLPEY